MDSNSRRYIFIEYEDLKKVKFKKLEKVCDKVFIMINSEEKYIPFTLVSQMQKLGKGIKWIPIFDAVRDYNYHICFLMGKLHSKVSKEIEFAILSNNSTFDPLVNYINSEGRSCLRVKRKPTRQEKNESRTIVSETENGATIISKSSDFPQNRFLTDDHMNTDIFVVETAKETRERLVRTGNRPSDISILRSYILLNNQELTEHGNVDRIIEHLEATEDIRVKEGEVFYNF